ncbi:MAG: sulfotransferase [Okeania sp. SIO2F4]|uniref:sulfotransferase family protein n=1 Tax=Okeania sp. SIO2F4 TaxID=2607790 RepID=UPI00142B3E30|nr:sulfotransferase [Okeania sp. SIO2F4]NES07354.1 sulfotransferase [Okeania sp. SIO2F4]
MTYFFIGGCPRSGTTLLQNIICSDTKVNPLIGEVGYLYHLVNAYSTGKIDFQSQSKYYFSDIAELRNFSAELINKFLEHIRKRYSDATHIILKYPLIAELFPDIYELVEDVKFILIIRDPRDTIASLINVGNKMAIQGEDRHLTSMFTERKLSEFIEFYRRAYAPSWNCKLVNFQSKVAYIKYEHLVLNPTVAIQQLQDFTGLNLSSSIKDDKWQRSQINYTQLSDAEKPWYSELYSKAISSVSVGRYRQVLRQEEINFIQREGADIFRIFPD